MYLEQFSSFGDPAPAAPADARYLPPAAPLAMPEQVLRGAGGVPGGKGGNVSFDRIARRRLFLVAGSFLLGLIGAREMVLPLAGDGIDLIDAAFFLLFFGLFAWITFGFLGAAAGFFVMLDNGPGLPRWLVQTRLPKKRTAVLMPICNEDVGAVFARLAAMTGSLASVRAQKLFDVFVLSDSRGEAEAGEVEAFRALRAISPATVYYRRRASNVARKPGNIADWVRSFGAAYEHMIILDADSLMSGAAMARLAAAMEERPCVGLIQTIPTIINSRTFFARWQQFAATAYGAVASAGLQWWSGSEATFWGHNAIVRTRAFAESCGLPTLSGREPFGGHVLSHDMVEAALLRRRGWAVHMVMLPEGSYEEFPPTLVDYSIRDRRWCQGNLQHLRLLGSRGFHWVNRLQLLMGASSYLTSPLWLMLLVVGLIEPLRAPFSSVAALPSGWLMVLTATLLLGPKLTALLWLALDHDLRASLGGGRRVLATVAIEIPLSMLIAPITMLSQTMAIIDIVRGRPTGWAEQRRDADGMDPRDATWLYRWHVLAGALFALAIVAGVNGAFLTLPIAVSLLASPGLAVLVSRQDVGDWLQRRGLFTSPHEARDGGAGRTRSLPDTSWSRRFLSPYGGLTLNP